MGYKKLINWKNNNTEKINLGISSGQSSSRDYLAVKIYRPGGSYGGFLAVWSEMFSDLIDSRSLTWRLFVRDFLAKYRQSLLGYVWVVLPPVVTASFFIILRKSGAVNINDTNIPYVPYVMYGMLLWGVFSKGIIVSANSIMQSGSLIAKINFPREVLIFSAMGNVFFTFLVQSILVAIVFVWYGVSVSWTIVFLPFLLFFCILFIVGIGFILSLFQAIFHDVGNLLGLIMGALMLTAPVVYPPPKSWPYSLLNEYNPLSIFITAARDLATVGSFTYPWSVLLVCLFSLVVFCVGWRVFRLCITIIAERLG